MRRVLPQGYSRAVLIGKGAFGTVFRARQDGLGRYVALKEVPRGDTAARDEAQALAASPLSCLPTVYGVVSGKRSDWIAMEYVHGLTLREVMAPGLDAPEAQALAHRLVASLALLHEAGRAHGDLKPENLIVEPEGQIRLVDLGLAGAKPEAAQGGTAGYLAPEKGSSSCDALRADLWSLGVVLHEVLVGARPTASDPANGWKRLRLAAPDWIPLLDLLWREDPSRRPATAAVLASELPAPEPLAPFFLETLREQADRNLASRMVDEANFLLRHAAPAEALALLQQALELDPDQTGALELLPQIRLGNPNSEKRRWWAIAAVAVLCTILASWLLTHRHRAAPTAVRASLVGDSGAGERMPTQIREVRKSERLPLREGRGIER